MRESGKETTFVFSLLYHTLLDFCVGKVSGGFMFRKH